MTKAEPSELARLFAAGIVTGIWNSEATITVCTEETAQHVQILLDSERAQAREAADLATQKDVAAVVHQAKVDTKKAEDRAARAEKERDEARADLLRVTKEREQLWEDFVLSNMKEGLEAAENREDALARELAGVKVTCEGHKLEQTRRREAAEDAYDVTRTRLETAEKELAAFQHSYAAEKAARYGAEARVCEMQADFDAAVHSFNHVFPDRDVDSGPPHQRFGMLLRFLAARLQGVQQEAKDLEFQNELYREAVEAVVEDSEDDGPINWGLNSVQNAKGVLERFKALARTETPKPYEASDAAACNEAYPESCPHLPPHKHKE